MTNDSMQLPELREKVGAAHGERSDTRTNSRYCY